MNPVGFHFEIFEFLATFWAKCFQLGQLLFCLRQIFHLQIEFAKVFEAEAHGKSGDVLVRMICYRADYEGTIKASNEIEVFEWLTYEGRERSSAVDKLIFDWLRSRSEI